MFNVKNLGGYHDLVQSDTLLLGDTFESFRDVCLKKYYLASVDIHSVRVLARIETLKMTEI